MRCPGVPEPGEQRGAIAIPERIRGRWCLQADAGTALCAYAGDDTPTGLLLAWRRLRTAGCGLLRSDKERDQGHGLRYGCLLEVSRKASSGRARPTRSAQISGSLFQCPMRSDERAVAVAVTSVDLNPVRTALPIDSISRWPVGQIEQLA